MMLAPIISMRLPRVLLRMGPKLQEHRDPVRLAKWVESYEVSSGIERCSMWEDVGKST
jgi:hypothetical protein